MWRQKSWTSNESESQSRWLALAFITFSAIAAAAADETTREKAIRALQADATRQIVISIPDRKLALVENGQVVRMFEVAVGAAVSPSPEGSFRIVNRLTSPTYYHTGKVIPAGKDNPLGTRWMGLSEKGFGIHGTNQPKSIGHAASHGCIRMAKKDLEELFELVRVGDGVEIHGRRDELVTALFDTHSTEAPVATANVLTQSHDSNDSTIEAGGQAQ